MGNCFAQGEAEGERGLAFDKASRFSQIALPFSQRAMWMGVLFDCYPVTPGVIIRVASLPLDHFNSLSAEGR